jgi:hypothetical protein
VIRFPAIPSAHTPFGAPKPLAKHGYLACAAQYLILMYFDGEPL